MSYDVFISYSSKDQKIVEALSHYLEERKVRCFVAYRDIPKGKVWAAAITDAIENSQMMVVVFSRDFNYSDQVDREMELASEEKMPILTFRIQDEKFTGAKKYYLKNLNWVDAFPEPEKYFGNLYESVLKLIDIKPETQTSFVQQKEDADDNLSKGLSCYQSEEYAEAVRYFRKAADHGHARAQYNLGLCYDKGEGVVQNNGEAVKWYRLAASQGHVGAKDALSLLGK